MKFLFAFLLVVASVHANSLHRYGWTSGKESVYKFESQVLNGIPEINNRQLSGIQLESTVRVQSFSDYSLRIKLENPKLVVLNEEVSLTEDGRIKSRVGESHMPEEFVKYLEQPFLVYMKNGVVQSFKVEQGEPSGVTNVKRSVLSQLQLDVAGTQRTEMESNHIMIPTPMESELSGLSEDTHPTYFHTKEESIHGKCKTTYTIQRIPEYKVKELEEQWVKEMMSPDVPTDLPFCKGKPYYQVIKSRNFDECEISPIFQKWTGVTGKCNFAKPSTCTGLLLSLSSSTYVICGELSQYQIRNIKTENIVKGNPLAYTTDESFQSTAYVNLNLLKVKSITERLPLPSQLKEKKSIIYTFPKQSELKGKISEETKKISKEILGVEPVLPQPNLEQAPEILVPVKLPKEQIKQQVLQQLKKMASEVAQSPESCSSKSDVTGIMVTVSKYLRALPLSLLEQLKSEITQGSGQELKPIEKLFWDTISNVGTNPSTMLVVKKIKEGSLPIPFAAKLIQRTIRNVRYPTKELLHELVSLAKHQTVKSHKDLLTAVLGNLSDLFYRAYINPSTMINNFPSQIYGVFGHKDTPVLIEEFIPYLMKIAKGEESGIGSMGAKQQLQYTAIASLGRTGHVKVMETLLKFVEGKLKAVKPEPEQEPMEQMEAKILRPLVLHSLKRVARMNPPQVKPLLMAIIRNPVEAPEVRTAAVAILPYAQPSPNDIQLIALRTWFEPSRQVANFIRSTLYSLVNTEVPEWQPLSGYVKVTLPLMKPYDLGYIFARNMQFNQFIEYLQTGVVNTMQLEQSKKSSFPIRVAEKVTLFGQNGASKTGYGLQMYMQGMDRLVEKYVKYFSYAGKTSEHTKQILEQISQKLSLEKRGYKQVEYFSTTDFVGLNYNTYLDHETVMETLESVSEKVNQGEKSYTFNTVSGTVWHEVSSFGMTDAGFPIETSIALPMVYSAQGHVKVNGLPDQQQGPRGLPEIEASITPVFNMKFQSTIGVVSPFTNEVVGTGVEVSVHSSIPLKVQAKIQQGELQVVIKNPSESERNGRETETLHGFILPFTYVQSLLQVKPVTKSHSFKKIVSQTPRKMEMEIGQSLGLSCKLYYESNNIYPDLASYIEKIRQTTLTSLPTVAIIPSSVRYSSTKIKYNPGQSETKEMILRLKLWSEGTPSMHGLTSPINLEEVEPEFHSVKSVLQKIKSSNGKATLVSLSASTKGQYSGKSFKSTWIVGKGYDSQITKTYSALNFKFGTSGTYSLKYEGEASFTTLKNFLKLDQLVQEDLQGQITAKFLYGKSEENEIVVKGVMKKTEMQKQAIKESPEYRKCQQHMNQGMKLSQVCREVRLQAASLDQFEIRLERYPQYLAKSSIIHMVKQMVESYLIGQITYIPESGSSNLQMKVTFERTGHVAQAEVKLPNGEMMKIHNIRLLGYPKNILPLPIHTYLGHSLKQTLSQGYVPYTCAVEPRTITTFDNRTYGYQLNGCEHVLLHDGAMKFPIAVLAKTVQSEKKEVRIISGESEIKLLPQGGSVIVKVNGNPIELPTGQVKVIKSPEGRYIMVELKKYEEGTCWVYLPQQGLELVYDGERIEVITTSGLLWSRAVGVCGDMNGEASSDLKSPKKCVMTPKIGAISYILNKQQSSEQGCPGIPSQYKEQYERESQQCLKEKVVPTPLVKVWENIKQITLPLVRNHVVDKHISKTCFSKHMVNVCKSEPSEVRNVALQFACYPRPSVEATTLEKRALAGEPLYYIIKQLPTVFTKVVAEPVKCKYM